MIKRSSILFALLALSGCSDPAPVGAPAPPPAADTPADPGQPTPVDPQQVVEAEDAGVPDAAPPVYRDEDFVESDRRRDPFRNFAAMFAARPPPPPQREVVFGNSPVEDLRLIAIISGIDRPRAMLIDAERVGQAVQRGDYLGRAEIMQTGTGSDAVPVTLNWRVDRIRPNEVVLTRDDPTNPSAPPLTRVMPLHENEAPTSP